MTREFSSTFETSKTVPTIFGDVFFLHSHLFYLQNLEPDRSLIAILRFFNLEFLHGMTLNHWEPNLSWNALKLLTSNDSSFKIKSTASLSQILGFIFRSHSNFSKFKPLFMRIIIIGVKKVGKASRGVEETPKSPLAAGRTACKKWLISIFTLVNLRSEFLCILS